MKKKKRATHWRFDTPLQERPSTQQYFTIGEVARMYEVEESQLRYWERHTPLAPKRTQTGTRQYTREDLKLVEKIRYLLIDKGFSLQAISKDLLKKNRLEADSIDTDLQIRDKLLEAREKVEYLRSLVTKYLEQNEKEQ